MQPGYSTRALKRHIGAMAAMVYCRYSKTIRIRQGSDALLGRDARHHDALLVRDARRAQPHHLLLRVGLPRPRLARRRNRCVGTNCICMSIRVPHVVQRTRADILVPQKDCRSGTIRDKTAKETASLLTPRHTRNALSGCRSLTLTRSIQRSRTKFQFFLALGLPPQAFIIK